MFASKILRVLVVLACMLVFGTPVTSAKPGKGPSRSFTPPGLSKKHRKHHRHRVHKKHHHKHHRVAALNNGEGEGEQKLKPKKHHHKNKNKKK